MANVRDAATVGKLSLRGRYVQNDGPRAVVTWTAGR